MEADFYTIHEAMRELCDSAYVAPARKRDEAVARVAAIGTPAIESLIKLWRSGDGFVKPMAGRALIAIGDPAVPALAPLLRSRAKKLRERTTGLLARIGTPAAFDVLKADLTRQIKRARHMRLGMRAVCCLAVIIMIWVAIDEYLSATHSRPGMSLLSDSWRIFQGICATVACDYAVERRKTTLEALAEAAEPGMIGILAVCANDSSSDIRKTARVALTKAIRKLQPSDYPQFSPDSIRELVKSLDGLESQYPLAVLKLLEQVGDEKALPAVEKLARGARDKAVRAAAEECLPFLRQRAEEARLASTLLRPAGLPCEEQLLRPAGSAESEAENLLRPAEQ